MRFVLIFLLSTLSHQAAAADYESAQRLEDGDVISAEVMNDILDRIELTLRSATSADLLGNWDVTQTTCPQGGLGNCSNLLSDGYGNAIDSLYRQRTDTVVFSDNGDGSYSYQTEDYCAFVRGGAGNSDCSGNYAVVDGRFIINQSGFAAYVITRVSDTRFILSMNASGSGSFNIIRLDKKGLAPAAPTSLSVTSNSEGNQLSWTAGDDTATSYRIMSKDEASDDFSELGTATEANFTDGSPNSSRQYRVFAINDNGTSIGSNVVSLD